MGIRKEESGKRAKYPRINVFEKLGHTQYYPIFEWSSWAIWAYIEKYGCKYPSLYDEGFDRIGCVICPYHTESQHAVYRKRWPHMFKAFERAVAIWFKKRVGQGRTMAHDTPEAFLVDWYKGKASWYPGKEKVDPLFNMGKTLAQS